MFVVTYLNGVKISSFKTDKIRLYPSAMKCHGTLTMKEHVREELSRLGALLVFISKTKKTIYLVFGALNTIIRVAYVTGLLTWIE